MWVQQCWLLVFRDHVGERSEINQSGLWLFLGFNVVGVCLIFLLIFFLVCGWLAWILRLEGVFVLFVRDDVGSKDVGLHSLWYVDGGAKGMKRPSARSSHG